MLLFHGTVNKFFDRERDASRGSTICITCQTHEASCSQRRKVIMGHFHCAILSLLYCAP